MFMRERLEERLLIPIRVDPENVIDGSCMGEGSVREERRVYEKLQLAS